VNRADDTTTDIAGTSGVDPSVAAPDVAAPDVESPDGDDDVVVLPWYRNPWNLAALLLAVLVLAGTGGFVIGERHATPDPNATDIGFLQDMRAHHEQAVDMALMFIEKPDVDPNLKTVADEIAFGQSIEIGRMIQLLREYGEPEANESGTGMAWMGQPVPLDRMPGLASDADLQALADATGADADSIFSRLMIAHHEGGIVMAEHAAAHAATSEVVLFAKGVVQGQRGEISELQRLGS
jgi:uncharacterized protein (DUF305 family)